MEAVTHPAVVPLIRIAEVAASTVPVEFAINSLMLDEAHDMSCMYRPRVVTDPVSLAVHSRQ
jgi:hypothetical protein